MRKALGAAALAALGASVSVSACGFRPMYAPSTTQAIGNVQIGEIEGKAGHELRTALNRRFSITDGENRPTRRLEIVLAERIEPVGIRIDESSTRSDMRLTASYRLTGGDGANLEGVVEAVASYDIPVQAYGELANQNDARERAAEVLAQRLYTELALRLNRQAK